MCIRDRDEAEAQGLQPWELTLKYTSTPEEFEVQRRALLEDIGSGDITAQLIPAERLAKATIITRDAAVIAGTAWVDAVFRQLDPRVAVHWQVRDGERVKPNQALFHLEGPARSLLTGERSALNFLQLLSGVATRAQLSLIHISEPTRPY